MVMFIEFPRYFTRYSVTLKAYTKHRIILPNRNSYIYSHTLILTHVILLRYIRDRIIIMSTAYLLLFLLLDSRVNALVLRAVDGDGHSSAYKNHTLSSSAICTFTRSLKFIGTLLWCIGIRMIASGNNVDVRCFAVVLENYHWFVL